jgi:superfamily I DNA/RNA helicase
VFVIGLNKGIFPADDLETDQLREKQRLLYVSMTRAKKKLEMYSARIREGKFSFRPALEDGEKDMLEPSPFLEWLPEEHVDFIEKWPHK